MRSYLPAGRLSPASQWRKAGRPLRRQPLSGRDKFMSLSGLIRVMERAARKAGGRLRRDFGEVEHLQVSRKGPSDFVSKADQASERTLWDELRAARPDWGFVLEEAGTIEGDP